MSANDLSPIARSWAAPLREGELLSSFLVRTAHGCGLTPWRFCNLMWPGVQIFSRDIDLHPDKAWLGDAGQVLGYSETDLEKASLSGLRQAFGGKRGGRTSMILSAGIRNFARKRHGLVYCPDCLRDEPMIFRVEWRLAMFVYCPIHGRTMLDACKSCDAPVARHLSRDLNTNACHQCGASLAYPASTQETSVSSLVCELQERVLASLMHSGGPKTSEALEIRALLAVAGSKGRLQRLRQALGLHAVMSEPKINYIFEDQRIWTRIDSLETVSAWLRDWPNSFREGAAVTGLNQRHFQAKTLTPRLADEVRRLPEYTRRRRSKVAPSVHKAALRKTVRRDRSAYRIARARILDTLTT